MNDLSMGSALFSVFTLWGLISFIKWLTKAMGNNEINKSDERKKDSEQNNFKRSQIINLFHQGKLSQDLLNEVLMIIGLRGFISQPEAPKSVQKTSDVIKVTPPEPASWPSLTTLGNPVSSSQASSSSQSTSDSQPFMGFMISGNIKTLLFSGSALLIFGAYLFTRSYWNAIPDFLKLGSLLLMSGAIYYGGKSLLIKGQIPKTAETLLSIGIFLVPINVYAFNLFILDSALSTQWVWFFGLMAMCFMALLTSRILITTVMGILIGSSFLGAVLFGSQALDLTLQWQCLVVTSAVLLLLAMIIMIDIDKKILRGLLLTAHASMGCLLLVLIVSGFFWSSNTLWITAINLILFGIIYAVQSRVYQSFFAYVAGLSFMGAGVLFLHAFGLPPYQYGLFFVPGSIIAVLRAWTFERSGRSALARPYFHLSQIALAGSLIALSHSFTFYVGSGYLTLIVVQLLAIIAYSIMGSIYKKPVFTYFSGFVFLFFLWTFAVHNAFSFASGILLYGIAASVLVFVGSIIGERRDHLVGQPFSFIGFGTLTLSLSLIAGKWGSRFLQDGVVHLAFPPDQLQAGLVVGGLSIVAYGLIGVMKKQVYMAFPALASATLVYLLALEKFGFAIHLLNVSWVVAAAVALFYSFQVGGKEKLGRCFEVWAAMAALGILVSALISNSAYAQPAAIVCILAFVPAVWMGRVLLTSGFLLGIYIFHYLSFVSRQAGSLGMENYALELIFINIGVIFIRSVLTYIRPQVSIEPFRIFAAFFSIVSLTLSLFDSSIAWVVFAIHGLMAILVSALHYQGRYLQVGFLLLLGAYELFLGSQNVELVEAYSIPAALYLLVSGHLSHENRVRRDVFYRIGLVVLYLPSFIISMGEVWELHGLFLGMISLLLMLYGMFVRSKVLTFWSLSILLLNGAVQSRNFFNAVPRWIYLSLGGTFLVTLGGLFEFKRETLLKMKTQLAETLEEWD